jgi:hypothetical protein
MYMAFFTSHGLYSNVKMESFDLIPKMMVDLRNYLGPPFSTSSPHHFNEVKCVVHLFYHLSITFSAR